MPKTWWSDCPKEEHHDCLIWNRKVKWMKDGYKWGFLTYVDYCNIKEFLGEELERIEEKYGGDDEGPHEEQLTLF